MSQAVPWAMFQLQELAFDHESSFLHALQDIRANDPAVLRILDAPDLTPKTYKDYVKQRQAERMDWRPKAGKVSQTTYVLFHDDFIYGLGQLRFPVEKHIEEEGGNLRFAVPPTVRRQGFGALTLNRMLFEAVRAGLARVSVSCLASDVAYRKCIEKNRGVLESDSDGRARYWIHFR